MSERLPVVVNASAGSQPQADAITAAFENQGATAQVLVAHDASEMEALINRSIAERPKCIVAAGGDGTVNAVASRLARTGIALGVLPLGTLNHFARDAGIPDDLPAAAATVVHGVVRDVDMGEVNGQLFVNNSSLGLYPRIVRLRERQQDRLGRSKWVAFASAAFLVFRRYSFMQVQMQAKGEAVHRRTPLVFIGNNRYTMEGLDAGRRTQLQAGELSVFVPRVDDRWGLVKLAVRLLLGRRHDPELEIFTTTSLTVASRRHATLVAVDGEVRAMRLPLEYTIHPRVLRVIMPATIARDEDGA